MNSIRRRLSYANVVATVALVFAMSGGALAAKHYLINSTRQINPKVLRKLKGNTGRTGATGATGLSGKEGARGEAGPAGQARAFGTITPGAPTVEPGPPDAIQAGSRGIVSAQTFNGITCVFLDPSIDLNTVSAVVTSRWEDVTFATAPGECTVSGKGKGILIYGFNPNSSRNETAAFSIVVP